MLGWTVRVQSLSVTNGFTDGHTEDIEFYTEVAILGALGTHNSIR